MNWLLVILLVFGFSSIAFYVALNNYSIDQRDLNLIAKDESVYTETRVNTLEAQNVEKNLTLQKNALDELILECNTIRNETISFEEAENSIQMYDSINASIAAASESCNNQIDILNNTLNQLINGINATADTLGQGTCQFNSEIDGTNVNYRYRRLFLNGVDFYYYIFDQSLAAITFNSTEISIESCSPTIFVGPVVKKAYQFGVSGYPIDYLNVGLEKVEFIPILGSFVNQTVELNGFQLWMGLF